MKYISDCFDYYEEAMSDAMFGGRTYDDSPVYERYEKNPHKHVLPEDKLCPECGAPLVRRKGPYGYFYGCVMFPSCHSICK